MPANCKGNDISTLQVQNGTEIGFPALKTIFHFSNIGAPFLVYGVGCEFSVQNILDSYFRLRPLVCRTFSADDSKQADNMYQTIEPFQVVLFFMGSVVLVRNSAVAIGSVVFGVDQANIMQQSLVLKLAAALGLVCPFIVAGTIQVQNVTSRCCGLVGHLLPQDGSRKAPTTALYSIVDQLDTARRFIWNKATKVKCPVEPASKKHTGGIIYDLCGN